MILYKIITRGLGDFYVIANNTLEAEEHLTGKLNQLNYGHYNNRKIKTITLITEKIDTIITEEQRLILI